MAMTTRGTLPTSMSADDIRWNKPVYLFHRDTFRRNVENLMGAFSQNRLSNLMIGFSVKTNPHPAVLTAARELYMLAEIVSPHELELARSCGFGFHNIIYNGVIPDPEGKYAVANARGIVNLESLMEFEEVEAIARKNFDHISVGIRLNVDIGNGRKSRFGIEPGSDEYQKVLELVKNSRHISIVGVHSHVYGGRQLKYWKKRVSSIAKAARELDANYIDLGSNMYGPMDKRMVEQFDEEIPTFAQYAAVVREALASVYDNKPLPMLILEPGTPVISNAVSVCASVMNIRTVRGQKIATANCTEYDFGFTPATKNVPVDVIHNSEGTDYDSIDIYGYTCTEGDVLHHGYKGKLAIGDTLLFRNLGAYSVSLSNSFIQEPLELQIVDD